MRAVEIERVYQMGTPASALEVDVVWKNIGSEEATFAVFYLETEEP